MRIGEITQDNYKLYMKMFGAKDTKALDRMFGKETKTGASGGASDPLANDPVAMALRSGRGEEGMIFEKDDRSWQKIVDVPDDMREKVISLKRRQVADLHNGMGTAAQGDEMHELIWGYVKTLPPAQRAAANWTLGRIAGDEGGRLEDYIFSKIPDWKHGRSFDKRLLTESNWGLNDKGVDVSV